MKTETDSIPLEHNDFPIRTSMTLVGNEIFTNYELGMHAARSLFERGTQAIMDKSISILTWKQKLTFYRKYEEDSRAGKGTFILEVTATFCTSRGSLHAAFAELYMQCSDERHLWIPNHCGTYICIDGEKIKEIEREGYTENLFLNKRGVISEDFLRKVKEISWSALSMQVKKEYHSVA